MMKFKLTVPPQSKGGRPQVVIVSLNVRSKDDHSTIEYEGNSDAVEIAQGALSSSHGLWGYLIRDQASPGDLMAAMNGQYMEDFAPELIEGAELLQKPD